MQMLRCTCRKNLAPTAANSIFPFSPVGLVPAPTPILFSILAPPPSPTTAFCKEARGDCKEALALYAGIIADSALSPGTSNVIFRTSVLLAYVGRFDEVRTRKNGRSSVARQGKKL